MFQILKQKIEDLKYEGSGSLLYLRKLIGATDLFFGEEAWSTLSIADIYKTGQERVQEICSMKTLGNDLEIFNTLKNGILEIMKEMAESFQRNYYSVGSYPIVNSFGVGKSTTRDAIDFELRMVEQDNIEWFKNRRSKFHSQPHDRLHNFYVIHTAGNVTTFSIESNSELPENIQMEAKRAFETAGLQARD
ncbi:MAG: hypothetical protein ACTHMM_11885 [Agriterribacter sp.]